MNLYAMTLLEGAVLLTLGMAGLATFLAFARLARGPSLPDRVIALDLLGTLIVGVIAAYAIASQQPVLLEPATVVALVAFLGTVAFARYVERRGHNE
jgi:multicomponent Na+:H+ antiporter subunit F